MVLTAVVMVPSCMCGEGNTYVADTYVDDTFFGSYALAFWEILNGAHGSREHHQIVSNIYVGNTYVGDTYVDDTFFQKNWVVVR